MKKIHKILLMAGLCIGLMLVPVKGQKEASAQGMPTIDLSNLVQNILKYLSDIQANGISIMGQSFDLTKFQEAISKFESYMDYVQMISKGAQTAMQIVDISKSITHELDLLKDMSVYFVTSGCPYSFYEAAQRCYDDFFEFSNSLITEAGDLYKFYQSVGKGESVLRLMQKVDDSMNKVMADYYNIVDSCNRRMLSIYQQDVYRRQRLADEAFLGISIY